MTNKLPAFVVLDGGGVKGAALAGCLRAAEDLPFEFIGYGGTSAGAIMALLAAAGYSGRELERIVTEELRLKELLEDRGSELERLKGDMARLGTLGTGMWGAYRVWRIYRSHRSTIKTLTEHLGLYDAQPLKDFLKRKLQAKIPQLEHENIITFKQFTQATRKVFKVLASDITNRRPVVFDLENSPDVPVIDAVRASMCYPVVFRPGQFFSRMFADGGLSSNLPVFLFEKERRDLQASLIAFDLVTRPPKQNINKSLRIYMRDLISTAMDASETTIQGMVNGLIHVPIYLDRDIHATDFDIDIETQQWLFREGELATRRFFQDHLAPFQQAHDIVQRLQARYGPPRLFGTVLQAAALEFELIGADNVRCHVMLPSGRRTRIVTYQAGMDQDPDLGMELPENAGCSGFAWEKRATFVADLRAAASDPQAWRMNPTEQNRIPGRLTLMMSIPIWSAGESDPSGFTSIDRVPIGIFSVDTDMEIADTEWVERDPVGGLRPTHEALVALESWSQVLGQLLGNR